MALAVRLTAAEGRTETNATGLSEGAQQRRRDAAARSEAAKARHIEHDLAMADMLRKLEEERKVGGVGGSQPMRAS